MKRKGISQYMLTQHCGVSAAQVGRLKKNMFVSVHTLEMLCKILDCRVEEGGLATLVADTHFTSNTVGVAAFRMPVSFCTAVPGDVLIFRRPPDTAVKVHEVMGRCTAVIADVPLEIGFGAARGSDVVDYDIFNPAGGAGVMTVWGQ